MLILVIVKKHSMRLFFKKFYKILKKSFEN